MHTRTTRRQFRLKRQTFSIWRPCWRPYWISRLAIIYANLCRQFQKLQTIGNILIYDTSCCTGGRGGGVRVTPRKSGQFHSLSPYQMAPLHYNELAQRMPAYGYILAFVGIRWCSLAHRFKFVEVRAHTLLVAQYVENFCTCIKCFDVC